MSGSNLSKIIENKFTDYSAVGISSYFSFRYPVLTNTMFNGYESIDPSHDCKPRMIETDISYSDAVKTVEKLLIEAVAKLVEPYKRIGVTLSGGLDSSIITAIIKKHFCSKELFTYSSGFEGMNEFEFSKVVADLYSNKHEQIWFYRDDFLGENSITKALIKSKRAPVHPNETAIAIMAQRARIDLCDVVLCGEGSDEIFGGYNNLLKLFVHYHEDNSDFYTFFLDNYRYFSKGETKDILNEKYYVDDLEFIKTIFREEECPAAIHNQVFYFLQRVHARGLLERAENALGFSGFNNAFPFFDSALVSFVNLLPFDYKIRWHGNHDTPKYILKKIAEKYLPTDIVHRNKIAFPVPYEKWFEDFQMPSLNKEIFKINNLERFNGWKKFMIYNLNHFIEIFNMYRVSEHGKAI